MRMLLAILTSMIVTSTTAQTHLPVPVSPYLPYQPIWLASPFTFGPAVVPFDNTTNRLQLIPYASVSAGFIYFNGAMSYVSAPVGLMLVRPLNNNLAAFSSVSVAPTAFSMSRLFSNPGLPSPYGASGYGLDLNARVTGGFIYTNDAKTFSISGSISVERGSYPVYPSANHPTNYTRSY